MSGNSLSQRREWFRYFPEGSIEFMLVTRVLTLFLLVALSFVRETQRPIVLMALLIILWIDYLLILWWAVQMATDMDYLFRDSPPTNEELRRKRIWAGVMGGLPSIAALLILSPWTEVLDRIGVVEESRPWIMVPALLILFFVCVYFGQRALQKIGLGPAIWTFILFIPVLHWFAAHRLLQTFQTRLDRRMQERGQLEMEESGIKPLVLASDITWFLTVVPWGIILVLSLLSNFWPVGFPYVVLPICGIIMATVFALTETAAMENLQQRFVSLLRKR
ncbi:MAG: hypothetical protein ACYTF1_03005 [Planctomycetota bacterium]|jgi:hypothetical protein